MNGVTVKPKCFTKQYMKDHDTMILKNRELIIEVDNSNPENVALRYKIGDGITSYKNLKYVSSLYSLFPKVYIYDKDYLNFICIDLEDNEE